MIFKSEQAEILCPKDQTIWHWLFESGQAYTPSATPASESPGFTDVNTKRHLSFADVKSHAAHLSSTLVKLYGLREGDVALIVSKNSIYFPIAALASVRAGGIACGASPEYNRDELSHALRLSKAKFLFVGPEVLDTALLAAAACGLPKENIFLIDGQRDDHVRSIDELIVQGSKFGDAAQMPAWRLPPGKTNRDVCAYFGFSSGTTGLPKAVMVSHANVIAQCLQMQKATAADHDKHLAALPFYHITGLVHQFHLPILLNANVYIVPKFSLAVALSAVVEYKIKEVLLVPPILIQMVRQPELIASYNLSHVRRFCSGAAPLSQEILTALEKMFPGTGFKQGYGMTESCSVLTVHPTTKYAYKYAHKVGQLVGSTELRIVDPATGQDCGIDTPGELWARGPQVTMGYLDNPKATAETFDADGFLHTGDVGTIDAEGFVSITDRIKDLVKVKGIGVAPAELEDLLLGNPHVKDAAVCGIGDSHSGERPKAYVVLQDNAPPAEEAGKALLEFVKSRKARHKWLAEVEIVGSIPKSAAGKILRRKLRDGSALESVAVVREDETRPHSKL